MLSCPLYLLLVANYFNNKCVNYWVTLFSNFFLCCILASKKELLTGKSCNSSQNFRVKFCYAEYVYWFCIFILLITLCTFKVLIFIHLPSPFKFLPVLSSLKVGDFYEAIGVDACILVEYAGLNPFGGLRSDSIPRAGCPVVVLISHIYFLMPLMFWI